jgi:hypothetical protein
LVAMQRTSRERVTAEGKSVHTLRQFCDLLFPYLTLCQFPLQKIPGFGV